MLKFLKNWTLPLAMFAGAIGYFLLANVTILEPAKPFVNWLIAVLTPFLIFAQLLLTFCKIEPKELLPKAWHVWLLSIQAVSSGIIALLLIFCPMEEAYRDIFEGAMVCLICPTATAAAVITGKLGGSASTLTTYTLLSNVLAAIAVPLVFPLVEPHADITFVVAAVDDHRQRLRPHFNIGFSPGFAYRLGLGRNIDHVRLAGGVNMGEL